MTHYFFFFFHSISSSASPTSVHVEDAVKRSWSSPDSQYRFLSPGLPATTAGLQTASKSETETSGKLSDRWPIIDHQSNGLQFVEDRYSYDQTSPGDITGVHRRAGEVRPASSIHTSPSQHRGRSKSSYNLFPVIVRKTSSTAAASLSHQSSSLLQDSQRISESKGDHQSGDNRQSFPLLPSQTGRYLGSPLRVSGRRYGGHKHTNEPTEAVQSKSTGVQSSKSFIPSQTEPVAPSISKSFGTSVIKHNPRPEKLASSITDSSQDLDSERNENRFQSYLFTNSQDSFLGSETVDAVTDNGKETSRGPISAPTTPNTKRNVNIYRRFNAREDQKKEVQLSSNNADMVHNDVSKYRPVSGVYLSPHTTTQLPSRAASGKHAPMESFTPAPLADFLRLSATGSKISVTNRPSQSRERLYGFRGFKKSLWPTVKKNKDPTVPSTSRSKGQVNSPMHGIDKGQDYTLRIANIYPFLSHKYSFNQRKAASSPAVTKISSPTPASTPSTSGSKDVRPPVPERGAGTNTNPDDRSYKRMFGLKGFGVRPHSTNTFNQVEGARTAESDVPAVTQGLESLRLSQMSQARSSSRHNRTAERNVTSHQLSRKDFKPFLKTGGSSESATRSVPDKSKKIRNIFSSTGFGSSQNISKAQNNKQWEDDAAAAVPSAHPRTAEGLRVNEQEAELGPKPVGMKANLLNTFTSSTVRGRRVKGKHSTKLNETTTSMSDRSGHLAIVRLPTHPARLKGVIHGEVLGSASFSGVRATTQTPITADKDTTATTKPNGVTVSADWAVEESMGEMDYRDVEHTRAPEASAEEQVGNLSSTEESKVDVRQHEGVDNETETSQSFPDNEGSGSGGFDPSDILSTGRGNQEPVEDLSELDYLRISTGNISFKSRKVSHTDEMTDN